MTTKVSSTYLFQTLEGYSAEFMAPPVPGRFYVQLQGVAIGSSISPIVANLYMEDFEIRAINSGQYQSMEDV